MGKTPIADDKTSTTNSTTLFRRRFFDITDPPETPGHTSTHVSAGERRNQIRRGIECRGERSRVGLPDSSVSRLQTAVSVRGRAIVAIWRLCLPNRKLVPLVVVICLAACQTPSSCVLGAFVR